MYPKSKLEEALVLLGGFLEEAGFVANLVVCGGAALSIQEVIARATGDVDVLALISEGSIVGARPLPLQVQDAAKLVALNLGMGPGWLNDGPASQIRYGFPKGFQERLEARSYGKALTVYLIGRLDQVHLKLFASADQGPGKHVDDLLALNPTEEEMSLAAHWVKGQDASDLFPVILRDLLRQLGYERIAAQL